MLLSSEALRRALAEEGQDEAAADHWPDGLRWRPEWDKRGYLDFSPLSRAARKALEAYLRKHPAVGEAFISGNTDPSKALDKQAAGYYLRRAEKKAGLPHQRRGGWHAFRRAWASRRKHLPVQDVMAGGRWRDVKALQEAYQASDPATTRQVMELA
ncbi:MAG: hypothetical protein WD960_05010 [Gemmatimonadota bacterium]